MNNRRMNVALQEPCYGRVSRWPSSGSAREFVFLNHQTYQRLSLKIKIKLKQKTVFINRIDSLSA
jgi:hypothetical protein